MQYDFNIPAGGGQSIDVAGRFFKYKSGIGAIRVMTNRGGYVDLLPGQGIWNVEFDSLNVKDISGSSNSGLILAGAFDFHDDRISGEVAINEVIRSTCRTDAFQGATALAANQVTQHIAPAANTNGILLRSMNAKLGPAAGTTFCGMRLVAAQAAPAALDFNAGNAISLLYVQTSGTAAVQKDIDVMNRRLPSGWGLWSVVTVQGAIINSATCQTSYEIL